MRAKDPTVLEREHVIAALSEMLEAHTPDIPYRGMWIRGTPHTTEWNVGHDGQWFSWLPVLAGAFRQAGLTAAYPPIRHAEYPLWRARLEALGFPVARGRAPIRASDYRWAPSDVHAAAAALDAEAAGARRPLVVHDDPLQVVMEGKAYPASAIFGLAVGSLPPADQLDGLRQAGIEIQVTTAPEEAAMATAMDAPGLPTEARRAILGRLGQGRFRTALLYLHGSCSVTGIAAREVLRAAHIHRWVDCADTPAARLDPENGLLLSASLDALFEAGLIAFADGGEMLLSPQLTASDLAALGLEPGMRLRHHPSKRQQYYLAKHRDRTASMRVTP